MDRQRNPFVVAAATGAADLGSSTAASIGITCVMHIIESEDPSTDYARNSLLVDLFSTHLTRETDNKTRMGRAEKAKYSGQGCNFVFPLVSPILRPTTQHARSSASQPTKTLHTSGACVLRLPIRTHINVTNTIHSNSDTAGAVLKQNAVLFRQNSVDITALSSFEIFEHLVKQLYSSTTGA